MATGLSMGHVPISKKSPVVTVGQVSDLKLVFLICAKIYKNLHSCWEVKKSFFGEGGI